MWAFMLGWLTPTSLFVFVNIIIGTIALSHSLWTSSSPPTLNQSRPPLSRYDSINADLLQLLPSLKLVVSSSTGANHVDKAECRWHGIAVTNAGNLYSEDVADLAVGLFIDVNRRISAADCYVTHILCWTGLLSSQKRS